MGGKKARVSIQWATFLASASAFAPTSRYGSCNDALDGLGIGALAVDEGLPQGIHRATKPISLALDLLNHRLIAQKPFHLARLRLHLFPQLAILRLLEEEE